jgi:hypothetical protein
MQMIVIILVSLLALWWLFCTFQAIESHRARLSLPPEQRGYEPPEQIFEARPRRDMHPVARVFRAVIVGVLGLSCMFIVLPFCMHAWFVRDPDKR